MCFRRSADSSSPLLETSCLPNSFLESRAVGSFRLSNLIPLRVCYPQPSGLKIKGYQLLEDELRQTEVNVEFSSWFYRQTNLLHNTGVCYNDNKLWVFHLQNKEHPKKKIEVCRIQKNLYVFKTNAGK